MSAVANAEAIQQEVEREITENKVMFYGKGSKEQPMCGFTVETCQFFTDLGVDFTVIDVLNNMEKRQVLSEMTNWPTLPKVFINGKFYGDTDVLEPMKQNGELAQVLAEAGIAHQ